MFQREMITSIATFTRPLNTTGYIAGDVISNSASASTLMAFSTNYDHGHITKVVIKTNKVGFVGAMRLWLVDDSAFVIANDNTALSIPVSSTVIGYIDIAASLGAVASTVYIATVDIAYKVKSLDTLKIYGVLTANSALTPDSGQIVSVELTMEKW